MGLKEYSLTIKNVSVRKMRIMSTDKLKAYSPAQTAQAKTYWLLLPFSLDYGVQIRHHLWCLSLFPLLRSMSCSFNNSEEA